MQEFDISYERRGIKHQQTILGMSPADAVAYLRGDLDGEITVLNID